MVGAGSGGLRPPEGADAPLAAGVDGQMYAGRPRTPRRPSRRPEDDAKYQHRAREIGRGVLTISFRRWTRSTEATSSPGRAVSL